MQELIVILVDGLVFSSYLFMVSVGLTVIFGVMKILNVTHGAFYAFGAYLSATLIGAYYNAELPEFGGFLAIFAAAVIVFGRDLGGNGKTSSMYTQFVKIVKYTQFVKGIVKNWHNVAPFLVHRHRFLPMNTRFSAFF